MYGIMRCEKRKMQASGGIHAENNRTQEDRDKDFKASDIDWERTKENVFLINSHNLRKDIEKEIKDHGIEKWRKDAITFIDTLYTATPEFFQDKSKEETEQYFKDCLEFHKKEFGDYIVNAVIHFDETTPHMHVQSVPLIKDEEKGFKLSAKELMGGMAQYSQRQDRFYEAVLKGYGLERGEKHEKRSERREHITNLEYREKALEGKIEDLQAKLNDIQGQVLTAEEIRSKQVQTNILGHEKKNVKIPLKDYQDLVATATAYESVELYKQAQDEIYALKAEEMTLRENTLIQDQNALKRQNRAYEERVEALIQKQNEIEPLHKEAEKILEHAKELEQQQDEIINNKVEEYIKTKLQPKFEDFIKSIKSKFNFIRGEQETRELDNGEMYIDSRQDKLDRAMSFMDKFKVKGESLLQLWQKEEDQRVKEIEQEAKEEWEAYQNRGWGR